VKWARKRLNLPLGPLTLNAAAESGNESLFRWLLDLGLQPNTKTLEASGKGGNIEIMRCLHEEWEIPFNSWPISNAATNGHLPYIQYAREHYNARWEIVSLARAFSNGHQEVAGWMVANGCPFTHTELASGIGACDFDWLVQMKIKHNITASFVSADASLHYLD